MYALIWVLVTWGLLKMRPEAAIGGFALSFIALIAGIMQWEYWECLKSIVETWAFVQAIRGTFAYQRFTKHEPDVDSGKKE